MGSAPGQVIHDRQFSKQLAEAKQIPYASKGGPPYMPHPRLSMRNFGGSARALPQATVDQTLAVDPFAVNYKKYIYLPGVQVTPIISKANWIK